MDQRKKTSYNVYLQAYFGGKYHKCWLMTNPLINMPYLLRYAAAENWVAFTYLRG